ncbi:MAG TPA: hypothetical protein VNJ04_02535 [Gemmatimonadaceae bacterium]|nr:hypothetical protein [Gemmatimonadaceae bacterium]
MRSDVELLRDAIQRSGLSARAFARGVLLRDERTVRRWLAGDSPIPAAVIAFLRDPRVTASPLSDRVT